MKAHLMTVTGLNIPEKIYIDWSAYDPGDGFDAIIDGTGEPRPPAAELARALGALSPRELAERQQAAENAILEMGITFTVYSEGQNIDRAWPFDIVPRPIAREEWDGVADGLKQRLRALNHFIDDVYHDQRIVKDGRFPGELIETSRNFLPGRRQTARDASMDRREPVARLRQILRRLRRNASEWIRRPP
jgi:uncharacterized circularly permuted ATP-grasp superfamily protein